MRGAGHDVWVKIRASEAERAEWHAKARSAGLTLSDLVRRSVGRVRASATTSTRSPAGPTPSPRKPRPSRSSPKASAPRSTRGPWRLMRRRVSQAGNGDGIRETALPARCPGSGAGSWGFKGGRSHPSPDRNVQHCVGWLMVPKPPGASWDRKRFPHPIRHSLDPSGPGFARLS